jgi:predicted PurR-regulated permease PerM
VAVLVAFAIGAEFGGMVGALLAMPIAATYPTIEKLWLREKRPRNLLQSAIRPVAAVRV